MSSEVDLPCRGGASPQPNDKLLLIVAALGIGEIETGALGWLSLGYSAARRPASDNVSNRSGPRRVDTA